MSNLFNSNDSTLNVVAKERTPEQRRKNAESTDSRMKNRKGWTKPTKCNPIVCFFKHHDKSKESKNDNRCNVFGDDVELDVKCEEGPAKKQQKEKKIEWKNI